MELRNVATSPNAGQLVYERGSLLVANEFMAALESRPIPPATYNLDDQMPDLEHHTGRFRRLTAEITANRG